MRKKGLAKDGELRSVFAPGNLLLSWKKGSGQNGREIGQRATWRTWCIYQGKKEAAVAITNQRKNAREICKEKWEKGGEDDRQKREWT